MLLGCCSKGWHVTAALCRYSSPHASHIVCKQSSLLTSVYCRYAVELSRYQTCHMSNYSKTGHATSGAHLKKSSCSFSTSQTTQRSHKDKFRSNETDEDNSKDTMSPDDPVNVQSGDTTGYIKPTSNDKKSSSTGVRHVRRRKRRGTLTTSEVSTLLRAHEEVVHIGGAGGGGKGNESMDQDSGALRVGPLGGSPVVRVETSKLASNSPSEDRRAEVELLATGGHLFGVFDGHGGTACAQAVHERVCDYIAISLLPPPVLEEHTKWLSSVGGAGALGGYGGRRRLVRWLRRRGQYESPAFEDSFRVAVNRFALAKMSALMAEDGEEERMGDRVGRSMEEAMLTLDQDIGSQGVSASQVDPELLSIALSGCCATVVHVKGSRLHAANVGDCRAVIGQQIVNSPLLGDMSWEALPLGNPHCAENEAEVKRLHKKHPNEIGEVIRQGRLLGILAPFRAFGDYKFKWRAQTLHKLRARMQHFSFGDDNAAYFSPTYYAVPMGYHSPPYLTARPEVTRHGLTASDKFLVIASDGLWDMFDNPAQDVISLVGKHMAESARREAESVKSDSNGKDSDRADGDHDNQYCDDEDDDEWDPNVATYLIRHALASGVAPENRHAQVSGMLTLPPSVARSYRDDITVTVVFFDSEYFQEKRSSG